MVHIISFLWFLLLLPMMVLLVENDVKCSKSDDK